MSKFPFQSSLYKFLSTYIYIFLKHNEKLFYIHLRPNDIEEGKAKLSTAEKHIFGGEHISNEYYL